MERKEVADGATSVPTSVHRLLQTIFPILLLSVPSSRSKQPTFSYHFAHCDIGQEIRVGSSSPVNELVLFPLLISSGMTNHFLFCFEGCRTAREAGCVAEKVVIHLINTPVSLIQFPSQKSELGRAPVKDNLANTK